jgi:L-threonylcarbamoyladenylate synthase
MRLLRLKNRPVAKGLIMVASSQQQLEFLLSDLTPRQRQTLAESWPGPVTWLVPHQGKVPGWVCGDHDRVAVRVSAHPALNALCAAWDGPLVSTSANRAGGLPAREAFQVRRYFQGQLDYLLAGRVGAAAQPTSIRDLVSGQIIRD